MMTTLASLAKPQPRIVSLERGDVRVYQLKLGDIAALLAKYPDVIAGLWAGVSNPEAIVATILETGKECVNDIIDAATRSPSGTAAAAELSVFDEAEILVACIDETIPKNEERMEKFVAELDRLLTRLGLNDAPETEG